MIRNSNGLLHLATALALLSAVASGIASAQSQQGRPTVTLVIACRNEERRLASKIENALKI